MTREPPGVIDAPQRAMPDEPHLCGVCGEPTTADDLDHEHWSIEMDCRADRMAEARAHAYYAALAEQAEEWSW